MDRDSLAEPRPARLPATADGVARRIAEDAAQHPERTYRVHVEAAQEIAAAEYQAEIRRMMREGRA